MTHPPSRTLFGALTLGSLLLAQSGCHEDPPAPTPDPESPPVHVQVLAFNDFHGNLEAPSGSNGRIKVPTENGGTADVNAGGAAFLAHHLQALRAENPDNTVVVSAGDLIGASPLISGIFHDEPTIEAMNLMGLDFNSVGNHEFDDGSAELLRMQSGGCHPVDGCQAGTNFPGAKFKFLSANVFTDLAARKTLFPAYGIREFQGVKVAFIGMTLEGTPLIVAPSGVKGLSFQDEADTVNALVPELQAQGVKAIVVVIHEGGLPTGLYDECPGISGPIKDIAERLDAEVDVVASGHTHQAYNCVINGKRVTSAASYGRLITDIDLTLDPRTGDVVDATARNVVVTRDTPDAPVEAYVQGIIAKAAPLRDKVIGNTPSELKAPVRPIQAGVSGESVMGNVVADAMLAATREPAMGGAVIALQNSGGVRADINAGDITFGEVFSVQPFANNLVTLTLTGAQLDTLLESQFQPSGTSILQPSRGFSFAWSASAPAGSKVDPASIKLDGVTVDPTGSYRITVNNFMASGGDGYTVLLEGKEPLTGAIDVDAVEAYLRANNPLSPPALGRITLLP
ncbi:bifunctional metallophosphatase/5'-nucleotidase [Melittangium boletus]|uniref:Bifunctional metallophosphatase/5'-nucleotidase n=1 Tax=Melittangium boletus DSM 14713 TaxID=1294270 RepID=A0A250I7R2_9BACT|nr:bifunctional metallophosphatase/5'-nucleotidase [Melittangium boletus]ATB27220.1 bifunctional metallophosphatase/5'-nucleotidase [Melittangium boletus DSM 14713]